MTAALDIFLSYNREDADVARRFADAFVAQGLDVWWDQALRSGEAYDTVTEAALRGAKAVVVLWSPRSVVSRWVRAEATIAERGGTLMPVRIEPCDLPVMFELTQTADLTHWQGGADDKAWRTFLGDVQRMVGKEAPKPTSAASAPAPATSGMPNVALVPFTHRGGGEEMEFLVEDLTEEITRELARSRYFKVIAARTMADWRGKTFDYRSLGQELDARYLVKGKLQRAGESVRLTLQLVDAETANVIWSPRFTGKADEIAADPEEFQAAVASQAREHIIRLEMDRAMAKQGPLSGWDHVLRCWVLFRRQGSDGGRMALEEARSAVAAAPGLGMAHAALATALSQVALFSSVIDDATIAEAREHIQRAIQLDGDNPLVLTSLAHAYGFHGDGETGLKLALRAAELDPNNPETQLALGAIYYQLGNSDGAIEALRKMDRLASADGMPAMALQALGLCLCIEGQGAEAEAALDRAQALNPNFTPTLRWKGIAAAQQGKDAEARSAIMWLRKAEPGLSGDEHVRNMHRVPGMVPHLGEPVAIFRRLWDETGGDA